MVKKSHRWSNLVFDLFSIVVIAACVLADNDISHHLEQGTGSVFYYYFGSIVFGGLYGVYFAPSFSVLPWCLKRDDGCRVSQKLVWNVISSGLTLAGGFILLFCALRIKMPLVADYENDSLFTIACASFSVAVIVIALYFLCTYFEKNRNTKPLSMESYRISILTRNILHMFLKILYLSISFCIVSVLFSFIATVGTISLKMEWGKAWMSLAMERYPNTPFDVPLSFVQAFTPLQAISLSAFLTIICSFSNSKTKECKKACIKSCYW
ncbi:MAG: hypothetical protein RR367_07730 [Clostridia bacterium]